MKKTAAAGDPDAQHELRIRMDGRHDPRVAATLVGGALDSRDRPADGHLEECRRRKGAPSRPAGTPIADPNRRLATSAACAAPAACPEACGHHASLVLARGQHPHNSRTHCSDGTHQHGVWRSHHGASVRTRAAGRLGSQARRHSGSVMIRRRSTCRTATSMHVAPTNLVADATRRMKCCSRNFNEHESEFDVRGAAEATAAARVRRVEARGGPAAPASPLPRPPPGGGRDGSSGRKWRSTCRSSDPTGTRAHRDIVTR